MKKNLGAPEQGIGRQVKVTPSPLVQETLKWNPTLPMKTPGLTSQGRNWSELHRGRVTPYIEGYTNSPRPQGCPPSEIDNLPETDNYDMRMNLQGRGFKVEMLHGLDAEETGDHYTGFYDTVKRTDDLTGETTEGFLERNNYLDRQ